MSCIKDQMRVDIKIDLIYWWSNVFSFCFLSFKLWCL